MVTPRRTPVECLPDLQERVAADRLGTASRERLGSYTFARTLGRAEARAARETGRVVLGRGLRVSRDAGCARLGECAGDSTKGPAVHHVPLPPRHRPRDLVWTAVVVLAFVLWLVLALSGLLEPLGWE